MKKQPVECRKCIKDVSVNGKINKRHIVIDEHDLRKIARRMEKKLECPCRSCKSRDDQVPTIYKVVIQLISIGRLS